MQTLERETKKTNVIDISIRISAVGLTQIQVFIRLHFHPYVSASIRSKLKSKQEEKLSKSIETMTKPGQEAKFSKETSLNSPTVS